MRHESSTAAPASAAGGKGKFREYVEAFGIALLIALIVRTLFLQAFKIPSSSMENTLLVGDHIFV
ncbi:MAG: S26 family signal peptidase, partial [Verrucomicrobiota bacterium]